MLNWQPKIKMHNATDCYSTRVLYCDCGTDIDDDRLSAENRDRDFQRGQRSPAFSRYSVDVEGRDAFWDGHEGTRGRLSSADDAPPPAKSFGVGRDGKSSSPPPAQQRPEKPRIWSLADVATSTTTASSGRRSPPQLADVTARPPPLPIAAPPTLSLPAGFQPWTNGLSGHPRHGVLAPPASVSSSPPATHRPLPPVANGLLRYAPYPVVVGGGHPTSHAAVSHQLAAAAVAHAAAVNAAVQARLQPPPISGPADASAPSAAIGRCSPPTVTPWPSSERHALKNAPSNVICTGILLCPNNNKAKKSSPRKTSSLYDVVKHTKHNYYEYKNKKRIKIRVSEFLWCTVT